MSKSPSSKNRSKSVIQDSPKSKNYNNDQYQEDDASNSEREKIRRKLTQDATDLLNYVTVELTVRSQMESTKKNIRELNKRCSEEIRMINDLERQIEEESSKKDLIESGEDVEIDDQDAKEINVIHELEEELKSLYEEKAALLANKKKKY